MFKRRTLFIVGAGASCEFDFPTSPKLANLIAEKANVKINDYSSKPAVGDPDIIAAIRRAGQRSNMVLEAAHRIRDGVRFTSSIDDFLDIHGTDGDVNAVGKLAIAKVVLEAERRSKLYFNRSNIFSTIKAENFEDTWIIKFVRMLSRGIPKNNRDAIFDNVAFIVFNYDRCIEHCLYHAIQQTYSIPHREAGELLKRLKIIHPYGKVGSLKTDAEPGGVAFGGEPDGLQENYALISQGIKTYTEQIHDPLELSEMHAEMDLAERIVFLGFAFHDQNMALLNPEGKLKRKEVYATAYGMSDNDVGVIRWQIVRFSASLERQKLHEDNVVIRNDLKCADLFDQYTRSLPA